MPSTVGKMFAPRCVFTNQIRLYLPPRVPTKALGRAVLKKREKAKVRDHSPRLGFSAVRFHVPKLGDISAAVSLARFHAPNLGGISATKEFHSWGPLCGPQL